MKRAVACSIVLVLGLSGCCAEDEVKAPPDLAGLKDIRIDYEHMGWGLVREQFTIQPAPGGGFTLRGSHGMESGESVEVERPVSPEALQAFLLELKSPAWPRNKGIVAVTRRIDRKALRPSTLFSRSPPANCTDAEIQQLAALHVKRKRVIGLVDDLYGQGIMWTDDYPFAVVQVRWEGQPDFVMSSRSQKAMMLPWDIGVPVDAPAPSGENWSLPLTASLRALLPPASYLHQRLDGTARLQKRLAMNIWLEADGQCDALRPRRSVDSGLPSS